MKHCGLNYTFNMINFLVLFKYSPPPPAFGARTNYRIHLSENLKENKGCKKGRSIGYCCLDQRPTLFIRLDPCSSIKFRQSSKRCMQIDIAQLVYEIDQYIIILCVSRTANVERNGGHKWVKGRNSKTLRLSLRDIPEVRISL